MKWKKELYIEILREKKEGEKRKREDCSVLIRSNGEHG